MSTIEAAIGEHDGVVLTTPVGRWPAGTRGTVVSDHPTFKVVEIVGIEESDEDMLEYLPEVPTQNLRLVWKCPARDPEVAGD
ncbi:MAG: hypothetical protein J0H06_15025 [Actinobacteria bacterium]|nr:hypothetical protein [Actinomycetota bacterium]